MERSEFDDMSMDLRNCYQIGDDEAACNRNPECAFDIVRSIYGPAERGCYNKSWSGYFFEMIGGSNFNSNSSMTYCPYGRKCSYNNCPCGRRQRRRDRREI